VMALSVTKATVMKTRITRPTSIPQLETL